MGAPPTLAENFHAVIRALRENYLRSAIVEDVEELVRKYSTVTVRVAPWNTPNSRHFSDFIVICTYISSTDISVNSR